MRRPANAKISECCILIDFDKTRLEEYCEGQWDVVWDVFCSTCVGVVTTNHEIEGKTEDEEDVVDMVNHANLDQLRVTCCLQLKGGTSYKFASI